MIALQFALWFAGVALITIGVALIWGWPGVSIVVGIIAVQTAQRSLVP